MGIVHLAELAGTINTPNAILMIIYLYLFWGNDLANVIANYIAFARELFRMFLQANQIKPKQSTRKSDSGIYHRS